LYYDLMIMLIQQNDKLHVDDMKWTGYLSTRVAFVIEFVPLRNIF
jgi:hypothetical protein